MAEVRSPMTAEDLIALNEQIAAMARAGLPLDQGLESLARDMTRGKLKAVTLSIADDLRAGHTLPEALERRGNAVPAYYGNLVVAGIRTGRLPEVLSTLTTYARTIAATRSTVIESLFYPIIVFVVGFGILSALAFLVLPQFDRLFQEFGLQLPYMTKVVLEFGRNPVEMIILPTVTFIVLVIGLRLLAMFTEDGRRIWSQVVDHLPLVGRLIRAARLSAFTDLLGMLVEHGVPLPTAFRLAGGTASDKAIARKSAEVEARLNQGQPIAQALKGLKLLPDWVAWLAAEGERKGSLAPALREIATIYRRQVDTRSAILRTVLPPFVVIATAGVLTVLCVTAIMLPMVKLLEGLSK